jgi:hypothetical protein
MTELRAMRKYRAYSTCWVEEQFKENHVSKPEETKQLAGSRPRCDENNKIIVKQ